MSLSLAMVREFKYNPKSICLSFLGSSLKYILVGCLDKVCRSVGYCTSRPMKVILRVIFIHEFMG